LSREHKLRVMQRETPSLEFWFGMMPREESDSLRIPLPDLAKKLLGLLLELLEIRASRKSKSGHVTSIAFMPAGPHSGGNKGCVNYCS
jgi:hypothetical protein